MASILIIRGEARKQIRKINRSLTVVGLAAGLGDTPLMICGDLQHEPRRQSRHLDFAFSRGWLTDLGQTQPYWSNTAPAYL